MLIFMKFTQHKGRPNSREEHPTVPSRGSTANSREQQPSGAGPAPMAGMTPIGIASSQGTSCLHSTSARKNEQTNQTLGDGPQHVKKPSKLEQRTFKHVAGFLSVSALRSYQAYGTTTSVPVTGPTCPQIANPGREFSASASWITA